VIPAAPVKTRGDADVTTTSSAFCCGVIAASVTAVRNAASPTTRDRS
jgi:hypothetical protein